jgi:host factor-I protein
MAGERVQSLQDTFLNDVYKSQVPLIVVLLNGVKLQGILTWFDSFSLLLKRGADARLVYKHALSTIKFVEPIRLSEHEDEDN